MNEEDGALSATWVGDDHDVLTADEIRHERFRDRTDYLGENRLPRTRAHTRTERSRPLPHSHTRSGERRGPDEDQFEIPVTCLLYTSDAADE